VARKRHSKREIATKLALAETLAAEGKIQSEIARVLDVSVMTLHRWRKLPHLPSPENSPANYAGRMATERDVDVRISDLQFENSRLRRLVTDLLLEAMELQEATEGREWSADERKLASQ
jgi:hypothetical protein